MLKEACAHAVQARTRSSGESRSRTGRLRPGADAGITVSDTAWAVAADYEDRMHEIRGSLAAVEGALEVLMSGPPVPADQRQRLADMLLEEVGRLRRLAAAPGQASPREERVEIDLDEVVDHVVAVRRLAGQSIAWAGSGVRVVARRDELAQVINILLVNAARHAAGSVARIEVVTEGSVTRVTVSDDGPGVPEELRSAVFQRGARARDSRGQGLGLSIARALVDDLGGTLALRDRLDHGASFEMTLPHAQLGGAA
jgi:signal transduction histidine kinase